MESILAFGFVCLASFFTLANPLGTMPVFLSMTRGLSEDQRKSIVWRATVISFFTLLVFTFAGQFLFKFFGISANGFRIAAGFIIFKIGYDMLQAKYTHSSISEEEKGTYAKDISITPLAIPMLCGPGAIANGIMLMAQANSIGMLITLISYVILRSSTRIMPLLGETGNNVMMRLMGLILMVIAVECFFSGLRPIVIDFVSAGIDAGA